MKQRIGWERGLSVAAGGKGLVGHAGAVLPRLCADRVGLTSALSGVFAKVLADRPLTVLDRGRALVDTAVSIVLGARSMSDIRLLGHLAPVFGPGPSDSTVRRTLELVDEAVAARIAKARARVRKHVWVLLAAREQGFPWLAVAGKVLRGWVVIDLDATLITAHSNKAGAAATFKLGFGFHPLGGWCANTSESLAMLLRPGNAGSNTVADHVKVLAAAIAQIPPRFRAKILIRIDGAGASHELCEHLASLNTAARTVRFTVGWTITATDEKAIKELPEEAWTAGLGQDGEAQGDCGVAELTGLDSRLEAWPGIRLVVRRVKASRRHAKNLTVYEVACGWRFQVTATNIGYSGLAGAAGSGHYQFLDTLHRSHATVEDRVRTDKAMGLRNLPSKAWDVNVGWVLAANIAADLDAWTRLLGLADDPALAAAEPETMRYRLYHLPARLVRHARRKILKIPADWPWAGAFLTCWQRLTALPDPG